jgi:hypothetical protein
MPPDHTLTKEWPMAGQPPDSGSKGPSGPKRKRPAEFAPAGRRGDDSITRNLKRVYEQVAAEPIPPDLMKLLDQLGDRNGEDEDV